MQKIAAERRRLQQQDEIRTARRVGVQEGRPAQARQQQASRRQAQRPDDEERRNRLSARRYAAAQRNEAQGKRYSIRQTGVKNIVGGRSLLPLMKADMQRERLCLWNAANGKVRKKVFERYDRRGEYARPRQAASYGGYAAPARNDMCADMNGNDFPR